MDAANPDPKPSADSQAALLPAAYARLRAIAAGQRRRLPVDTLQTTALVNEAWLRLASRDPDPAGRERFFGLFGTVVRNVLVDHVRARQAQKREGDRAAAEPAEGLAELPDPAAPELARLLAIDAALGRMAEQHARLVKVVELRFFAGYENQEIADLFGISEKTVRRDWLLARAMLAELLDDWESP